MPHYRATHHAIDRLTERFPALVDQAADPYAAGRWLAQAAQRGQVAAQQIGMDLLLCVSVPEAAGDACIYLPVTPQPHDTWLIRTVLTPAQAGRNLARQRAVRQEQWRVRCRGGYRHASRRARVTADWAD